VKNVNSVPMTSAPSLGVIGRLQKLRRDSLLRNSFFLASSNAIMSIFGFAFWLLNARLYSVNEIGIATSLISAASMAAAIGLCGMNNTFVRFLPSSEHVGADINSGLLMVFLTSLAASVIYVLFVPLVTTNMRFVRGSYTSALLFVMFSCLMSLNIVTDSVFIAFRRSHYNVLIDGFLQGISKLSLAVILIGLGAYGIFSSVGVAAFLSVAASLFFMKRVASYRPRLVVSARFLRESWHFSSANYIANLLSLCPVLILPIVILDLLGPSAAAYYYLSFQFVYLLNAALYAVGNSLLAEASCKGSDVAELSRRAAKLIALVSFSGGFVLAVAGHWLLLSFGAAYSLHGTLTVVVFAISAPTVGLYAWGVTLLRIRKQLGMLICVNALFMLVTVGLAVVVAHLGLAWVAAAWLVGNLVAGVVASVAATLRARVDRR
jgi:O-antigen/teichoic acid export membrane protein